MRNSTWSNYHMNNMRKQKKLNIFYLQHWICPHHGNYKEKRLNIFQKTPWRTLNNKYKKAKSALRVDFKINQPLQLSNLLSSISDDGSTDVFISNELKSIACMVRVIKSTKQLSDQLLLKIMTIINWWTSSIVQQVGKFQKSSEGLVVQMQFPQK